MKILVRTARLVLRPFRESDKPALLALLAALLDRSLFASDGRTLPVARLAAKLIREPSGLAIVLRGKRKPVGGARLNRNAEGVGEVGLWLAEGQRQKGLGREALEALLELGFDRMDCTRIEGTCLEANTASRAIMTRCGMREEGSLRSEDAQGKPVLHLIYGLTRPKEPARAKRYTRR